jgi:ATP-dependent Lon protease
MSRSQDTGSPPPPEEDVLDEEEAITAVPPEPMNVLPVRLTATDPLPSSLGLVPTRELVVYPGMVTPLVILRPAGVAVVRRAAALGAPLAFVAQRDVDLENPERDELYDVGTVVRLLRVLRFADGSLRILVEGLRRVLLGPIQATTPARRVALLPFPTTGADSARSEVLARHLRVGFQAYGRILGKAPPELDAVIHALTEPERLGDYVAGNLALKPLDQQGLLAEADVERRLELLSGLLGREQEMAELANAISDNVQGAMDRNQREYFLREQLRAVKEELGEYDPTVGELAILKKRVAESGMPDAVQAEADRELERMARMHREAAEYTVARTYIDWLLDMPWGAVTEDAADLDAVQAVLEEDHHGLAEPKERILEYLSVRRLNPDVKGPILCLIGPPGVGKTSLGRSIARALGRKFQRLALGGVKDESEIRGHRRTYIGSMPGRIIQAMKRAGSRNPVIVLDEIDKVGNDFRGDPASALLEALDPEQNHEFVDHYLDVPFDLSGVMFICTANVATTIPPALKDRMEILELPGYIEEEKLEIAGTHLLPKTRKDHGLPEGAGALEDGVVGDIVRGYTSEAGVRGLERELSKIARKVARKVVAKKEVGSIGSADLIDWLGPRKYFQDMAERTNQPGIAVGLAWTGVGGDILFIEATQMPGERKFKVTGQLGDVMKESAETALSWVRANAVALGIDSTVFKTSDLHIHLPQGGIPKDGPSAGITIIVALVSLLTGKRINPKLAMTGEITLRGKVEPVGGIKEKVLAARRAGIEHVLLPRLNLNDLLDIPEPLRNQIRATAIDSVDDVWDLVWAD